MHPDGHEAIDTAVNAWLAGVRAGREVVLMAWRRSDAAALNERAHERFVVTGLVAGQEPEAPGGNRYATGDPVVTLGAAHAAMAPEANERLDALNARLRLHPREADAPERQRGLGLA